MAPRDQLSSYDPAPESIQGADSLPNPPQRGPEAVGRRIDSIMASGSPSPFGTPNNPKIKLSPLAQVLIALGVVVLIAIMVLVWTTIFGSRNSNTTASESSRNVTTPTVSVPQLAPSTPLSTPSSPSEEALPDSLHEDLPAEIASHVPQEIRDKISTCNENTTSGYLFGAFNARATSCVWVDLGATDPKYMSGTMTFTTDKKLAEGARKPLMMKKVDIGLKPTEGHDILVSSLPPSTTGPGYVHITDFVGDGTAIIYLVEGGKDEAEAFLKKFHLAE